MVWMRSDSHVESIFTTGFYLKNNKKNINLVEIKIFDKEYDLVMI